MSSRFCLMAALALSVACDASPTATSTGIERSFAPAHPHMEATAQSVTGPDGQVSLEVAATLTNGSEITFHVRTGESCPLFVHLFWNPTGEYASHLSGSWACPPEGETLALVPGDSAVLTRVLGPEELSDYEPGTYGIDVAVTLTTCLLGTSAGNVQLPLAGGS